MRAITLLQELLLEAEKNYPNKTAIVFGTNRFTYTNLLKASVSFAYKLKACKLSRGDRVVICLNNSIEVIVAFWGVLLADGIVSVINPEQDKVKIRNILQDSAASIFVSDIVISGIDITCINAKQINLNVDEIVFDQSEFKNIELDLASIIYTSGSTGEPKGVMMTHRSMLTAINSINQYLNHREEDVILSALPLSFDYGLYQMLMAVSVGATLVLETNALFPAILLKKIEIEKVTVLPCVPTLITLLSEHSKRFKFNFTSLRAVTNTGAALTQTHIQQLTEIFPYAKIYSMYGLTECKRCTYLPPEDIKRKPGSVGIAIPNTELWIVDDSGQKVRPGVVGQLVIRGATVMKGYWNKPLETNIKLKVEPITGEKVLFTGDYALQDEEGYLYFKGRMDEIIKYKGMKISPIELEAIINQIPEVKEVAVLELSDHELAFCVCLNSHANFKNIKAHLPKTFSSSSIYFLESLPKNSNGKIDKKLLRLQIESEYAS